jgi:hypothetical protein
MKRALSMVEKSIGLLLCQDRCGLFAGSALSAALGTWRRRKLNFQLWLPPANIYISK